MDTSGTTERTSNRKWVLPLLMIAGGLLAALITVLAVYGPKLSDAEINGVVGLLCAGQMELTGKTVVQYQEDPPRFLVSRSGGTAEDWAALGVTLVRWSGGSPQGGVWHGLAMTAGQAYTFHGGAFTSRYIRVSFEEAGRDEVKTAVYNDAARLCFSEYGCEGPLGPESGLDELKLTAAQRDELIKRTGELYGVEIPDEALAGIETLGELAGYIEDRL